MRDFVFEVLKGLKTKEIPITRDFIAFLEVVTEGDHRKKRLMDDETLNEAAMTNLSMSTQQLLTSGSSVHQPIDDSIELCEKNKEKHMQEIVIMDNLCMNNAQGLMNIEAAVDKPTSDSHESYEKKVVLMKPENSMGKGKQISNSLEVCKKEEGWYHNVPKKPRTMRVEVHMNPTSMDSTINSEKRDPKKKFFEGESSGTKIVKPNRIKVFKKDTTMDCTEKSEKKASKRKFFEDESSGTKVLRPKKQMKNMPQTGPNPKPDLPTRFKDLIRGVGGSDPVLVIQKPLFATDVSDQHGRLSIPINQVEQGFELKDDEKRAVDIRNSNGKNCGEISAWLIGPSMEESEIKLRKWDMKKPGSGGKNNPMYVLTKYWNDFRRNNGLFAGMVVQIWSFQLGSHRWFVLVRVGSEEEEGSNHGNSSGDGASTSGSNNMASICGTHTQED